MWSALKDLIVIYRPRQRVLGGMNILPLALHQSKLAKSTSPFYQLTSPLLKSMAWLSGILPLLMLQGCALTVANWITPDSGYDKIDTLSYGEHKRQNIDIFFPAESPIKQPLLVFFYGGAWEDGNKKDYRFVAQAFTQQGYRVAIPDYRLYPEVRFPGFIHDGSSAVAALAKQFPGTPLVLMGHSAGAHIAAMLALNQDYLNQQKIERSRIAAFVGWSGPYDFLPLTSDTLKSIFVEEQRAASQPINFVNATAPPTLLIHGLDDTRVKPKNSKNLERKLQQQGVPVTTHYYQGVSHVDTVGSLIRFLSSWSNTLPDTLAFLTQLENTENIY